MSDDRLYIEDYANFANIILGLNAAGAFYTSIFLANSLRIADKRQIMAFHGDQAAAMRVLLPCYRPLFVWSGLYYLLLGIFQACAYEGHFGARGLFYITQAYALGMLVILSIVPVLIIQVSISIKGFWRAFYFIFPWATISLTILIVDVSFKLSVAVEIAFVLVTAVPPIFLGVGILTKLIKSRVRLGSTSNRNAIELMVLYGAIFAATNSANVYYQFSGRENYVLIAFCQTLLNIITNFLFPFALYRTLLADTKYWRGIGKHNTGGVTFSSRGTSLEDLTFHPNIELSVKVASNNFQTMMAELSDMVVNFAYVQVDKKIGRGATSNVCCGRFKNKLVAIKISTPPELTPEEISGFIKEARTSSRLSHENIVQFYGICVRPPEISMIFELCEGGDLKTHLEKNSHKWSKRLRLRACWHAAEALTHVHNMGYIHRDIKAENFFVDRRMTVKLGDFGEATFNKVKKAIETPKKSFSRSRSNSSVSGVMRSSSPTNILRKNSSASNILNLFLNDPESVPDPSVDVEAAVVERKTYGNERGTLENFNERMTILGTVAFMAPELIRAEKHYSEKIDVYALGMTYWEIWSKGLDPYANMSTFHIYDEIAKGHRLRMPNVDGDLPEALEELVNKMWHENPTLRISANEVAQEIRDIFVMDNSEDSSSRLSSPLSTLSELNFPFDTISYNDGFTDACKDPYLNGCNPTISTIKNDDKGFKPNKGPNKKNLAGVDLKVVPPDIIVLPSSYSTMKDFPPTVLSDHAKDPITIDVTVEELPNVPRFQMLYKPFWKEGRGRKGEDNIEIDSGSSLFTGECDSDSTIGDGLGYINRTQSTDGLGHLPSSGLSIPPPSTLAISTVSNVSTSPSVPTTEISPES